MAEATTAAAAPEKGAKTAKGKRVMQEGRRRRVAALTRALQGLSEKELQRLVEAAELMERLARGLWPLRQ